MPPFTFVGFERVSLDQGRGEDPLWSDQERFVDGSGRNVSTLDIWRAGNSGDDGHGGSGYDEKPG